MSARNCLRCDKEMVRGYLPDFHWGTASVAVWAEGKPKNSLMYGLKLRDKGTPMGAFRCPDCGMVEFVAQPGLGAEGGFF